MAEYIELEAAITKCREIAACEWNRRTSPVSWEDAYEQFAEDLEELPPADVAPVRHSYWETYITPQYMGLDDFYEPKFRDGRLFICHERQCRYKTVIRSNYCPKCGAKMDGGVDK